VLARAGVDVSRGRIVAILGVTGGARAREVVVDQVEIVGARLGPVTVLAHDVPQAGVEGLLGRDLLGYFNLTTEQGAPTLIPK
jgi:hypothetical protein